MSLIKEIQLFYRKEQDLLKKTPRLKFLLDIQKKHPDFAYPYLLFFKEDQHKRFILQNTIGGVDRGTIKKSSECSSPLNPRGYYIDRSDPVIGVHNKKELLEGYIPSLFNETYAVSEEKNKRLLRIVEYSDTELFPKIMEGLEKIGYQIKTTIPF